MCCGPSATPPGPVASFGFTHPRGAPMPPEQCRRRWWWWWRTSGRASGGGSERQAQPDNNAGGTQNRCRNTHNTEAVETRAGEDHALTEWLWRRRLRAGGMRQSEARAADKRAAVTRGAGGTTARPTRAHSTLMARSTGAFKTQHATTTSPVRARAAGASGCIRHRQSRGTG